MSAAQAGSLASQRPRSRADVASALPYVLFLSYPLFWFLGIPWLWGITLTLPMTSLDLGHQPRSTRVLDRALFLATAAAVGRQLIAFPDRVMAFMFGSSSTTPARSCCCGSSTPTRSGSVGPSW